MLELYFSQTCPYCKKVLNHFNEMDIDFVPKDIALHNNYDMLMKLGKISQVPFLFNTETGEKMYESDKIIVYADNLKHKGI